MFKLFPSVQAVPFQVSVSSFLPDALQPENKAAVLVPTLAPLSLAKFKDVQLAHAPP